SVPERGDGRCGDQRAAKHDPVPLPPALFRREPGPDGADRMRRPGSASAVLAVDIGGTKVAIAVVAEDGSILARDQLPTPSLAPEDAAREILERARVLAAGHRVAGCGIVLPAVVSEQRVAWAAESVAGWERVPLADLAN